MRTCSNCGTGRGKVVGIYPKGLYEKNEYMDYRWLELRYMREVPVTGDGGGVHEDKKLQFCDVPCLVEWIAEKKIVE